MLRQIFLDTETTGLRVEDGHRIIEIGCVEMIEREVSGRHWHYYLQPDRAIDEGAMRVHGISADFLKDKPRFSEVVDDFLAFVEDSELIIHNAPFDVKFIDSELARMSPRYPQIASYAKITDSLLMARKKHPGQKNSLDKLCERYRIDHQHRTFHGALKDALLLAEVYRAMTGGQIALQWIDQDSKRNEKTLDLAVQIDSVDRPLREGKIIFATPDELRMHQKFEDDFKHV